MKKQFLGFGCVLLAVGLGFFAEGDQDVTVSTTDTNSPSAGTNAPTTGGTNVTAGATNLLANLDTNRITVIATNAAGFGVGSTYNPDADVAPIRVNPYAIQPAPPLQGTRPAPGPE